MRCSWAWGMGHGAWGMGHGAWGMGHGALGIGHWALGIGHWALGKQGIGRVPYFAENRYSFFSDRTVSHINSGSQAEMISNPRFIVGRKIESRGQQIIRAIFIFLLTVNSQQSPVNIPMSIDCLNLLPPK